MATPPRMVEIACPKCQHPHWEIDHDFRGSVIIGQRELSYHERTYECPACHHAPTGFRVLRQSPPEFFLQPHAMYPMSTREFARWLAIFRVHFPSHHRLGSAGVFWYPGEAGQEQKRKLRNAQLIGAVGDYKLSLSNYSPDDERIRVCVQGRAGEHFQRGSEAHFWCGPDVELSRCYFGFTPSDIETIRELLVEKTPDIRRVWQRFSREAKQAQEAWLTRLLGLEGGEDPRAADGDR